MDTDRADRQNRRLAWKLAGGAVLMLGFGYLLVPLYEVYCKYTGFQGITTRIDFGAAAMQSVDRSRWVNVEFIANTQGSLPWEFRPEFTRLRVHPGELVLTRFYARNLGNQAIDGQAIPSVTPGEAAAHFHKIECFCFSHQALQPGEAKNLPLQFQVDPALPKGIETLTLAYTFFVLPEARGKTASSANSSGEQSATGS